MLHHGAWDGAAPDKTWPGLTPHPAPPSLPPAGPLKALQARTYDCARVQFSGEVRDTYFGGYEEDLKCGPGVYCFASGAFYVGTFKVGG